MYLKKTLIGQKKFIKLHNFFSLNDYIIFEFFVTKLIQDFIKKKYLNFCKILYIFSTYFVIIKINIKFITKIDLSLILLINYKKFKLF